MDRSLSEVREIQCDIFSHLHSVLRGPMKIFLFTDYREKKKAIKEKAALERKARGAAVCLSLFRVLLLHRSCRKSQDFVLVVSLNHKFDDC